MKLREFVALLAAFPEEMQDKEISYIDVTYPSTKEDIEAGVDGNGDVHVNDR